MADDKADAAAASPQTAIATDNDGLLAMLREIRDTQREAAERQARFLWLLIPIFAVLCVEVVLQLFR